MLVGYTKIRSPYDGVITKRNFFRGAFIRSAAEGGLLPLLIVSRIDKVRVVTQVPDRDVPLTNVGDAAEITLDALGDEVFKGKVSRFAETEDPTSRTMHTEIDLANPNEKLRPGMYGIAKIILDTSIKSSTLPASCLVGESRDGNADVFIVRDGKARKVQIKVGVDDGLRVDVISGITPRDDVIRNTGSVTNGMPARSNPNSPAGLITISWRMWDRAALDCREGAGLIVPILNDEAVIPDPPVGEKSTVRRGVKSMSRNEAKLPSSRRRSRTAASS